MIKTRTITLSLTAVTLSACAHSTFLADDVTRQDTGPYQVVAPAVQNDLHDMRMAQLDHEVFHLSTAFAANEISEDDFAARLASIEAERAGLLSLAQQVDPAPVQETGVHSARSTVSLL